VVATENSVGNDADAFVSSSLFPAAARKPRVFLFFAVKPGDGYLQTFGNGGNLVIHQITFLPLNPGNRSLIENDSLGSQPAREVIL
jgi:hypothetical protein